LFADEAKNAVDLLLAAQTDPACAIIIMMIIIIIIIIIIIKTLSSSWWARYVQEHACAMQSMFHTAWSHGDPDMQDPPPILACTQYYLQTPNVALGAIWYKNIGGLEIQSIV